MMPGQTDGTDQVIADRRRVAFCFQTIEALSAIRASFTGAKRSTALAIYLTFTEIANQKGGVGARSGFEATRSEIADAAGVSPDTLDRYAREFAKLGLLVVERRTAGAVNLPNLWALVDPDGAPAPGGRTGAARGGRTGAALRARDPLSGRRESSEEENTPGAPKLHKIDGQDIAFNALRDVCGITANDRNRSKEVAIGLNGGGGRGGIEVGIRTLVWEELVESRFEGDAGEALEIVASDPERFEQALAVMIQRRAGQYREAMPGAILSPIPLAKWWLSLEQLTSARRDGGLTAAEMASFDG